MTVTATATVTQSVTETHTVTATQTVQVTVTHSGGEEAGPTTLTPTAAQDSATQTPANPPAGDADSGFDVEWAHVCAGYIVEDIAMVDERVVDGIGLASAFDFLADSYECLADRGAPPGVDSAEYLAQLLTLQDFAEQAAGEATADPLAASARYSIIREETPAVLDLLNEATGSSFHLP